MNDSPFDALTRRQFGAGFLGSCSLALAGCLGDIVGGNDESGFRERGEERGFSYRGQEGGIGFGNSGVFIADIDRDDRPEIVAIGGETPQLFDNDDGEFIKTTLLSDAFDPNITIQTAVFIDTNQDGWEDLILFEKHGPAHIFENRGGVLEPAGWELPIEFVVPTSVACGDVTGNGYPDLFIAQMGDWADGVPAGWLRDEEEVGPLEEDNGAPNYLLMNDGEDFSLAENRGIDGDRWSLASSMVDLTGNGHVDIHVANDFNRDVIYLNAGGGRFEQHILPEETDRNGMSSLVADITGNGLPDIFVTNIYFPLEELEDEEHDRLRRHVSFVLQSPRIEGNNLIVNEGDGEFSFQADEYGIAQGGWGWAALAADFDHDGDEEIFHVTQNLFEVYDPPIYTYPMYFKRDGDRFERQDSAELGFTRGNDRAAVMSDLDGSGAMDLLVGTYNADFRLYENHHADGHCAQFDVRTEDDAIAIGSTLTIEAGDSTYRRVLTSASDYQSQSTRTVHVGLGDADTIDQLTVRWPDTTESVHEDVEADSRWIIRPDAIEEAFSFS